jgi:hypothetical protein
MKDKNPLYCYIFIPKNQQPVNQSTNLLCARRVLREISSETNNQ